jgi:hypothetical protein
MRIQLISTLAARTTALLALSFTAALSANAAEDEAPAGGTPEGAAHLAPFKQQLMGALMAGFARGPVEAVDSCHLQAPEIAAGLSGGGVQLGRTSHRLRNPANAGPDWATEVLQGYLEQSGGWTPKTVALAGGREGYVEPIVTQPLCLTCHGTSVAPEVLDAIAERYPEDQATGFETGDLRGVFWVSYAPADDSADVAD